MDKLLRGAVPQNFARRHIVSGGKNAIWEVDLIDFGAGEDHHRGYIICAIDQFDRRAYLQPIASKSAVALRAGMNAIFARSGGRPDEILADQEAGLATLSNDNFPNVFHTGRHANLAEGLVKWTRNRLERLRDAEVGRGWRHLVAGLEQEYGNHEVHIKMADGMEKFKPRDAREHVLDRHYAINEIKNFEVKIPFTLYDLVLLPNNLGDRDINYKAFHKNWNPRPWIIVLILHNNLLQLATAKLDEQNRIIPDEPRKGSVYPEQCKLVNRSVVIAYLKTQKRPERAPERTDAIPPPPKFESIIRTRFQLKNGT